MLVRAPLVVLVASFGTFLWFLTRGKLTVDLGWGRRFHSLGPVTMDIHAPRDMVYQQLSSPYLGRTPSQHRERLEVIERGTDVVLARHVSHVSFYDAETLEVVRFEEPNRISFRHVRGPVPHATEEFELTEDGDHTRLTYRGELGIDFWFLGSLAGKHWVVPVWLSQVRGHLDEMKEGVEQRAAARRRRAEKSSAEQASAEQASAS